MPETRSAKRRKLEETSKSKKRTKPKSSRSKQTKRPKLEPPNGATPWTPLFKGHSFNQLLLDEDIEEETLKEFDLDTRFGACIGISRLARYVKSCLYFFFIRLYFIRWKRAKKFGLKPPNKVKLILTKYLENDPKNKCLWTNRV